jgi:hypothetical protein
MAFDLSLVWSMLYCRVSPSTSDAADTVRLRKSCALGAGKLADTACLHGDDPISRLRLRNLFGSTRNNDFAVLCRSSMLQVMFKVTNFVSLGRRPVELEPSSNTENCVLVIR